MPAINIQNKMTTAVGETFAKTYANALKNGEDPSKTMESINEQYSQSLFSQLVNNPDGILKATISIPAGSTEENSIDITIPTKRENDIPVVDVSEKSVVSLQIIDNKGQRLLPPYTEFYIESISEGNSEKLQIVETFEDPNVYFFGSKVRVYNFSGKLRNDKINNWANQFELLYEAAIKGTRLAEMKAMVYLIADDRTYVGFPISTSYGKVAQMLNVVNFNMAFLVIRKIVSGPFNTELVANLAQIAKDKDTKKKIDEISGDRKIDMVAKNTKVMAYFEFPKT